MHHTDRLALNERIVARNNIVGVIASHEDLKLALARPHLVDIFEWRVDCLEYPGIERDIRRLGKPIILTVRDCDEGGKQPSWDDIKRKELFMKYLSVATIVDIEARKLHRLESVAKAAVKRSKILMISMHDLDSFPDSTVNFDWVLAKCIQFGARIMKLAPKALNVLHVRTLLEYAAPLLPKGLVRLAAMSLGEDFGPITRELIVIMGVVLVYGSIDTPVIKGQLSVRELRHFKKVLGIR